MNTCIYLRKSRADIEAEKEGEFETLHRHKTTLLKIAKDRNLNIVEIKEELVSGEHIEHRPRMIELLDEVKNKKYDAVLVMDLDRLGRGNMQDQGLILDTFKQSKTKIITPRKVYNLDDEFDEEYSEFEAFMARKELKLINRRLQRGRAKSIEEGKYISPDAPYGYKFKYDDRGKKNLVINPEQAKAVKLIFDMYIQGNGATKIANKLNALGYRTNNDIKFKDKAVRDILSNITYTGYLKWKTVDRKNHSRIRPENERIVSKGNHEAIIDEFTFNKAQSIRKNKFISPNKKGLSNPLAGILVCKRCGHNLVQKLSRDRYYLTCRHCDNRSSYTDYVEKALVDALDNYLNEYKVKIQLQVNTQEIDRLKFELKRLEKELKDAETQKNKLFDFLERGIYDEDTFLERSNVLKIRIDDLKKQISESNLSIISYNNTILANKQIIPNIENVLENYYTCPNAKDRNILLKSVLDKVLYEKGPKAKADGFILEIYPKLPK
ncbi:MAG: recombinase family protein [Paeniclostridium sordellii]|nr:recombinase family protein [Paeniclostridium sordellii]